MKITQVCWCVLLTILQSTDSTSFQLYTYPVKSLRSVPLTTSALTPHGFPYDRRFMLIKVHDETPVPRSKSHLKGNLENMTVTFYPELTLFLQHIDEAAGTFTVNYSPPDGSSKSLEIPLSPPVSDLKELSVSLHQSPAKAYRMDDRVNEWFSSCLGYHVILAYLGPNRRPVLGNLFPNIAQSKSTGITSWLSSATLSLPSIMGNNKKVEDGITFADIAPYLVVTEESLQDLSSRFADGTDMDITKFRPNIVLSGSTAAYEEDYWGEITIQSSSGTMEILLTQNCGRCVSINVDYSTGKTATGEAGNALKKLMKDRRVDKGNKWSPIFGRYGFLKPINGGGERKIAVGDSVSITKVNQERTTFGKLSYACRDATPLTLN